MTTPLPDYPVEKCEMTRTEPFDFAQCHTHDTTFALGTECKFNGKVMVDVLQAEIDEQRGLKVRAELEFGQSRMLLGAYLTAEAASIPQEWLSVLREYADEVPAEHTQTILEAHLRMNQPRTDDHG